MSRKYTIEEVRGSFSKEDYVLVSSSYENSRTKLKSICPNGHFYEVTFTKWLSGHRCLCESGKTRLNIDIIREKFSDVGYKLLSTNYKHGEKLEYICPENHEHNIRWDHFQAGHRCPYCNGRSPITIDDVRKSFESEGYKLLSTEYINSNEKLEYVCPKGHQHSIRWHNWVTGYRCQECAPNMKKTLDFVRSEVEKEGYTLLTTEYKNHHQKLHLLCPKGHNYYVCWSNWKHQNSRCTQCSEWGTSFQEKKLTVLVENIYSDVILHDRKIISPYELDIVIPSKKIAIEYCGLYWHSELAGKDRKYHLNKLEACEKKGYRLITIFEDELVFNEDIIFSRLKNMLCNEDGRRFFARKCIVKEISTVMVSEFCNKNHIQGYGSGAKTKLGAFHNGELVSVMTFSKPSIAKGSKTDDLTFWELHRFCSKKDCRVVGVASKLLKYFERNYNWSKIISYADRRWSVGNVYDKLGFSLTGITRPNYWYIDKQRRLHRFNLRKKYDDPKNLTEWEIRKSQGWDRIWDCGNLRYEKKK